MPQRLRMRFVCKLLIILNQVAADEDSDSDVDLFSEETKEEKKVAEERAAVVKASGKKKECEFISIIATSKTIPICKFDLFALIIWWTWQNCRVRLADKRLKWVGSGQNGNKSKKGKKTNGSRYVTETKR
nr:hypothetical protein [Tanacetum cinerariifolium]